MSAVTSAEGDAGQKAKPAPNLAAEGNMVRGRVAGFQQRLELARHGLNVWDFRVERWTADGTPLPRVPVEMRGRSFKGVISNGDWVESNRRWKPGTTHHVDSIKNLSTGATVHTTLLWGRLYIAPLIAALVFGAIVISIAVYLTIAGPPGWSPSPDLP